jgi:hypothetical protein
MAKEIWYIFKPLSLWKNEQRFNQTSSATHLDNDKFQIYLARKLRIPLLTSAFYSFTCPKYSDTWTFLSTAASTMLGNNGHVMWLLGLRGETWWSDGGCCATVPMGLQCRWYYLWGRAARAKESWPQGLCPRPGKREGISFLILVWLDSYISSPYIEVYLTHK